jgi:5S rRNA maturation endonuclease (ribonuclease M5)
MTLGFILPGDPFEDPIGVNQAHEYYKQFGISKKVLRKFHVRAITSSFFCINRLGELKEWRISKDQLTIAYESINHFKVYRPGADKFKFQYFGNKPPDFVFGQSQIIKDMILTKHWERDLLIIAAGEKDVMALTEIGYDSICLNSETVTNLPMQLMNSILNNYKRILVLYDLDRTGRTSAITLRKNYGFQICTLPDELKEKGGKDVSDYLQLGLNMECLHQLINQELDIKSNEDDPCILSESIIEANDKENSLLIDECKNSDAVSINLEPESACKTTSSLPFCSPLLEDHIFNMLPNPLKEICEKFTDLRERDVVFLSSILMASTLFPSLKSINTRKTLGANLSLFITAPPASGKGVADWGRYLGSAIQKGLRYQYNQQFEKYQKSKNAYKKESMNNSETEEMQKPVRKSLFIPANTSVSKMIEMLGANGNFGIIFETEGDTLAGALKTEWGNFSDIIRRCFHHETLSLARKGNDEFIEVDNPHLSILLTGTPKQVSNLIDSVENGFFSRLMFYDFQSTHIWRSQLAKFDMPPLDIFFDSVAQKFNNIWVNHEKASNTFVKFTDEQIDRVDAFFKNKQQLLLAIYGPDIVASVHRSGVVCQRIAMILSALRHLEKNKLLPESLNVSEDDMYISLSIIDTLLIHLQIVFTRMQGDILGGKLNFQQRKLWDALSEEFTRKQYDATLLSLNIENKTGEKYIGDFQKKELLIRVKHGHYQKVA